jgi:hypothetical protein
MSRVMAILNTSILANTGTTCEVLKWLNYCVVPMFFMFAGLHRAWSTAATPFEGFVGTIAAIGFAMLWPIFVNSFSRPGSGT